MEDLQFVSPVRQRSWGWLAVLNLSLGGAGAGFYLIGSLITILGRNLSDQNQFVSYQILAPLIVCCGFFALAIEAGQPMRAYRIFNIFSGSWMSIESLAGVFFIFTALVNWIFPSFFFYIATVSAALIFMISQGFIVYRAGAVTAWNVWLVPVIFVTSGFMTACGLALLNTQILSEMDSLPVVISLICVSLNLAVWLLYLYWHHDADFRSATGALRSSGSLLLTVGVGHLLPLVLLFFTFATRDYGNRAELPSIIHVVSGLALIVGGFSQKSGIILKAGYLRGIILKPVG